MTTRRWTAIVALSVAATACTTILGVSDVPVPVDGGDAADGSAGTDADRARDGDGEGGMSVDAARDASSTDGGSADAPGGDAARDAGVDAPPPPTCNGTCGQAGCTAFTCIGDAPSGWVGPFQIWSGPPAQAPSCPAPTTNSVLKAFANPEQTAAACSTCTCSGPDLSPNQTYCEQNVTFWGGSNCTYGTCPDCLQGGGSSYGGRCSTDPTNINVQVNSITWSSTYASVGCAASAQNPTVPPIVWDREATGCKQPFPQQNGCMSGNVCVPIPSAPYTQTLCITAAGDIACPAGPYSQKSTYYQSAQDTRGCTACQCAGNSDGCTAGAITFYSDTQCSSQVTVLQSSSGCQNVSFAYPHSQTNNMVVQNPRCDAVQSQPNGAVTPTGPVTVCCTP